MSQWLLVTGEVVALGAVTAYTCCNFASSDALSIILAFAVAYLIPRFIYSRSKAACTWGQWWLLVVGALMAVYTIYSIKVCTQIPNFSLEEPNLHSDDGGYYSWALSNYDGRCPQPNVIYCGVSIVMLALWKVLGVSIVWPLALNFMCILLAIVTTGKIAHRLLSHHFTSTAPSAIVAWAMVMTSLLCFLVSQSVRIQKEAFCTLAIVVVGYSLAGMSLKNQSKKAKRADMALFVAGTLLLAFVRTNFVYFIVMGAVMMAAARKGAQWKRGTLMAAFALAVTFLFNYIYNYTIEHQLVMLSGGEAMARDFKIGTAQLPYVILIGDYHFFPEWERLLLIPITTGVQYIIPFPWLYDYSHASILSLLPRIRLMWYIVGGACIFYFLYINVLHPKTSNLGMWAWWPLVTFACMSYVTGGLVSRYALPIQPLFVVIALYVFLHFKEGRYRRSFTMWMIVYTLILVATLVFCYDTQVNYLRSQHII